MDFKEIHEWISREGWQGWPGVITPGSGSDGNIEGFTEI